MPLDRAIGVTAGIRDLRHVIRAGLGTLKATDPGTYRRYDLFDQFLTYYPASVYQDAVDPNGLPLAGLIIDPWHSPANGPWYVEAGRIPYFLEELVKDRFFTPTKVDIDAIDTVVMQASPNNFVYGPRPVARVTISCESLYLREWTASLMPEDVKTGDLTRSAPSGMPLGGMPPGVVIPTGPPPGFQIPRGPGR